MCALLVGWFRESLPRAPDGGSALDGEQQPVAADHGDGLALVGPGLAARLPQLARDRDLPLRPARRHDPAGLSDQRLRAGADAQAVHAPRPAEHLEAAEDDADPE